MFLMATCYLNLFVESVISVSFLKQTTMLETSPGKHVTLFQKSQSTGLQQTNKMTKKVQKLLKSINLDAEEERKTLNDHVQRPVQHLAKANQH